MFSGFDLKSRKKYFELKLTLSSKERLRTKPESMPLVLLPHDIEYTMRMHMTTAMRGPEEGHVHVSRYQFNDLHC